MASSTSTIDRTALTTFLFSFPRSTTSDRYLRLGLFPWSGSGTASAATMRLYPPGMMGQPITSSTPSCEFDPARHFRIHLELMQLQLVVAKRQTSGTHQHNGLAPDDLDALRKRMTQHIMQSHEQTGYRLVNCKPFRSRAIRSDDITGAKDVLTQTSPLAVALYDVTQTVCCERREAPSRFRCQRCLARCAVNIFYVRYSTSNPHDLRAGLSYAEHVRKVRLCKRTPPATHPTRRSTASKSPTEMVSLRAGTYIDGHEGTGRRFN